jgi:carboxyl-terminal processing protease
VTDLVIDLRRKSQFFNYAVHLVNAKPEGSNGPDPTDDELLSDFRSYLQEKEYTYTHPLVSTLASLKKDAQDQGYDPSLVRSIEQLESELNAVQDEMFSRSKEDILRLLKTEIASKQFSLKRGVENSLKQDSVVQKAREILRDRLTYSGLLSSTK